ncbi:hypothetical protein GOBAR_AA37301 [Gossypium barbadense]|uniref:SWIM-type domain-containing protein n=1 Tax=Gossypium barbadense TaxID=3634 RepID=A0A2P5VX49_GOSBA|nr:hypothetical protein GOBAR_AA37301 [Gossypium barbadense]
MEVGHLFVEDVRDAMVTNHWIERRFQTLHCPCVHVVAACAKVNLNVEQFVDDVYTLERTLRVWENEFPVLPDMSTWDVPPTTFELVPDRGLLAGYNRSKCPEQNYHVGQSSRSGRN